jgi:hypothetical protein
MRTFVGLIALSYLDHLGVPVPESGLFIFWVTAALLLALLQDVREIFEGRG